MYIPDYTQIVLFFLFVMFWISSLLHSIQSLLSAHLFAKKISVMLQGHFILMNCRCFSKWKEFIKANLQCLSVVVGSTCLDIRWQVSLTTSEKTLWLVMKLKRKAIRLCWKLNLSSDNWDRSNRNGNRVADYNVWYYLLYGWYARIELAMLHILQPHD